MFREELLRSQWSYSRIARSTSSRVTWSQGGECAIGPPRSLSAYIYAAPAVAALIGLLQQAAHQTSAGSTDAS